MTCVTGDETGLVKVWDIKRSSSTTLQFSYGAQGRERGVASMCWVDKTMSQVLINMNDNTISMLDLKDKMMLSAVKREGVVSSSAYGMQVINGKLFVVQKDGRIGVTSYQDSADDEREGKVFHLPSSAPDTTVEACHLQRRYGQIAIGGKDNNLQVWSTNSERWEEPLFKAMNVRDHVLDVPYPVHIVGCCVVDAFVYGVATAYHDVRFYDRRVSGRPVQEFRIDREINRRPTAMVQWNCNKYLISEASGDIHLYDTRRGFTSRAKLRGGVGSVRHMVKHPGGHQVMAAIGLDRKVRIYHVPTGNMLSTIYVKQKGTAVLLDGQAPFVDNTQSYQDVVNAKVPVKARRLGEKVWNEMDPVVDEFEDDGLSTPAPATPNSMSVRPPSSLSPSPVMALGSSVSNLLPPPLRASSHHPEHMPAPDGVGLGRRARAADVVDASTPSAKARPSSSATTKR